MQFFATAALLFVAVSAVAIPPPAPSSTPAPDPAAIAKQYADFDFTPMAKAIAEADDIAIAEAKAAKKGTATIKTSATEEEEDATFDQSSEIQDRDLTKRGCFGLSPTSKIGKICIEACVGTCTLASAGLASTLCAKACSIQL
ncbi:hypothetical protein HYFRA_00010318 [Hymenoscyphus fraxineus]|uniref:Uncharacterized protein n=1 Tax=Hymenoscyphus fraxineus TaxID=746836 RepID=A0A9N9L1Q4_9HELO|nr:hypothetical protein HYFRA_00010318 [Hymenoscyphus fraxineus]